MRNRTFLLLASLIAAPVSILAIAPQPTFAQPAPTTRPAAAPNRATLNRSAAFTLDRVALDDALDAVIRDQLGLNLAVNWPALEAAGVDRSTPISLRLRGVPARKVIDLILQQAGNGQLAWYVTDNVMQITTRELADRDMVTCVYPVQDLVMDVPNFNNPGFDFTQNTANGNGNFDASGGGGGGGNSNNGLFGGTGGNQANQNNADQTTNAQRGQQLVDLVRNTISPEIWVENGGFARISYFNGSLVVTAPRRLQTALGG